MIAEKNIDNKIVNITEIHNIEIQHLLYILGDFFF